MKMNKQLMNFAGFAGLFALALTAFAGEPGQGECGKIGQFQVEKTSFFKLPLESAIGKLLRNTPIKVKVENGAGMTLGAEDVSGPLDVVLAKLAESSGFTYSQEGCELLVRARGDMKWEIRLSDGLISRALKRWEVDSGWRIVWDSPKDFPVMAGVSFSGSIEAAIEGLVESLASSDAPMKATFHPNKVARIVRFDGQTSELRR